MSVIVPGLAGAVIDVDGANAALHQAAGQQAAVGERRVAVLLANRLRLLAEIEDVDRFGLHAVGRFHRLDAAFEKFVLPELLLVLAIHRLHQIQLPPLRFPVELLVLQVADHLVRLGHRIVEARALMLRGQEARASQPAASRPGLRTTKPGRFWFSLPRPYEIHAPIDGRVAAMLPE